MNVGIDLGGTTTSVVALTPSGERVHARTVPTGDHREPEQVLDRIAALARELGAPLGAVGIGVPGEVEDAVLRESPILPTWRSVPVGAGLRARLGVPVVVDNDANAALVGEWRAGAGLGADPVLLVTLGTGIGGAIGVGGVLVRGNRGSAGEIGHVCVDPAGPRCGCGARGCLGLYASATAIVAAYRAAAGWDGPLDGEVVARRHALGDAGATSAVEGAADALAAGIAAAAVILAPERVILAGGILAGLGGPLVASTLRRLSTRTYPASVASTPIVLATLGPLAGAVGAAHLAMESR